MSCGQLLFALALGLGLRLGVAIADELLAQLNLVFRIFFGGFYSRCRTVQTDGCRIVFCLICRICLGDSVFIVSIDFCQTLLLFFGFYVGADLRNLLVGVSFVGLDGLGGAVQLDGIVVVAGVECAVGLSHFRLVGAELVLLLGLALRGFG